MRGLSLVAALVLSLGLAVARPAAAEILPTADLAVSLSENRSPEPAVAGITWSMDLTYTITVRNNGTAGAQAVTLGDPLPLHTTFLSFSQTSGPAFTLDAPPTGATGTVTAMTATLGAGASANFALTVAVDPDTAEGTVLINTARVTSQTVDPIPANDAAATTTRVTTYAGFYVDVSAPTTAVAVLPGAELSFALTLENNGPSDAQAVVLTNPIPTHATFVSFAQTGGPAFVLAAPPVGSAPPAAVSASIGTLALHATGMFTLVVRVDPDAADGVFITDKVTVNSVTRCTYSPTVTCGSLSRGYPPHPRSDEEGVRVSSQSADLAVGLTDTPDPVQAGSELTYVVSLVNNGPSGATNIWLKGNVPTQTTLVSWTQSSGPAFTVAPGCCETNFVWAHDGQLASGEAATFTLVLRVDGDIGDGSVINNSATIEYSNQSDPVLANNAASTTTDVAGSSP